GYVIIWLDDLLTVVDHWIIPVETDAPLQGGFRINSILPYQGDTLVIQGVMTNYVTTDLNPFDDTETVSIEDNVGSFFAFYSVPGFFTNTEPASNGVSFAIYPNPASESITVRGEKLDRAEYSIYDLRGRLLKRGQRASDGLIDVSDLTGGVYLINLRTGEGSGTRRFVVW
ncbi:MAG TPA: T9SS type A sorting domain-containing protein, partial [Cryomorphaceae bacterium]|nr:T9SS type A sorting domain-containing protein [Cryomorphaceae bacterium]